MFDAFGQWRKQKQTKGCGGISDHSPNAQFKRKCADVFEERLQKSKVVLVSHSMPEIKKLCDVVLLVRDGAVQIYDDVDEGIKAYNT